MIELHVIVPGRTPDLVARVVDGRLVIVPPPPQDAKLLAIKSTNQHVSGSKIT